MTLRLLPRSVAAVRRLVVLAAAATLVAAVASADAASPGFRYGVAAGEITSTSAVLWTRAPATGPTSIALIPDRRGARLVAVIGLHPTPDADQTVAARVTGLEPATRYRFVFEQGKVRSATGTFETAPPPRANARIRFAISGDADATAGPNGKPGFNRFQVYGRMAAEKNDFNINLGDTIYSDSELAGTAVARTVPEKWGKYRLDRRPLLQAAAAQRDGHALRRARHVQLRAGHGDCDALHRGAQGCTRSSGGRGDGR